MLACRSEWDSLPDHLSTVIIGKLVDSFDLDSDPSGALRAILLLRLISKSWEAAISQYVGGISMDVQRPLDLLRMGKLLPHISRLLITSNSGPYQRLVRASTQRSSPPSYPIGRDSRLCLNLRYLPLSLVDLSLSDCQIYPDSFEHFSSANVTSFGPLPS